MLRFERLDDRHATFAHQRAEAQARYELIELTLMLTTKPTSERALPTADPESSWENSSVETAGIEPASAIA